jgi:hypothetical protein
MKDCIICNNGASNRRYGQVTLTENGRSRNFKAHRVAWARANGVDPWSMTPDMVIRHTCDVPLCIEPSHLVLGSQSDNMQDAASKGRLRGQDRTHCPKGHVYDEANTYVHKQKRYCRVCKAEEQKRRRANA